MIRTSLMLILLVVPLVTHLVLVGHQVTPVAYGLVFAQAALAGSALMGMARPTFRIVGIAAVIGCILTIFALHPIGWLLVSSGGPHALIYCGLLYVFGTSLLAGREAVATRIARTIHGELSEETIQYTRRVTWAWVIFFCLQLAGSAILFAIAPTAYWSAFVNILNAPLLATMFLAERLSRPLWLADPPREYFADLVHLARLAKEHRTRRDLGFP